MSVVPIGPRRENMEKNILPPAKKRKIWLSFQRNFFWCFLQLFKNISSRGLPRETFWFCNFLTPPKVPIKPYNIIFSLTQKRVFFRFFWKRFLKQTPKLRLFEKTSYAPSIMLEHRVFKTSFLWNYEEQLSFWRVKI